MSEAKSSEQLVKEQQIAAGKTTLRVLAAALIMLLMLLLFFPHYWAYWKRVNADADAYYLKVVRCPAR